MSKKRKSAGGNRSSLYITGALVAAFFMVALFFRVYLPYDKVFVGDWIKFTGADSYYYMRLVDNMAPNFPHALAFDPYFIFPGGGLLNTFQFFNQMMAGISWVLGFGAPSQHLVDLVGAYFPALLGALVVIPVFFIGRALFNRWAGVLAAALITILPGEFMGRSILGYTDQHIAETLFSTTAMMFTIFAIQESRRRGISFQNVLKKNWALLTRPLVYSLIAGFCLGIYLITWSGALLFGFIITVYFVIQFLSDHLKHTPTDYLCLNGVIIFIIGLIILAPIRPPSLYIISIAAALLVPVILFAVSHYLNRKKIRAGFYPLVLTGVGAVGLGVFYLIAPDLFNAMTGLFSVFAPSGAMASTTLEMQPVFFPNGTFTLDIIWGNFTTDFYIGIFSMLLLIVFAIRHIRTGKANNGVLLFLIWDFIILAAMTGQRRFGYYFAVNVALLTGYFCWLFLGLVASLTDWLFGQIQTGSFKTRLAALFDWSAKAGDVPPDKKYKSGMYPSKYLFLTLACLAIFFFAYYFNIPNAVSTASSARFAPSDAWCSAMDWLRLKTPEPFGNPDFYYARYETPPPDSEYPYPQSAYSVASWWDYGYWISRMGHRLPSANPAQNPGPITDVAQLLLTPEKSPPADIVKRLKPEYVVVDYATATSKFWAVITWSGRSLDEFFEVYYLPREGKLVPVQIFYPAYYQTLCTRLYNFDNKTIADVQPIVVTYENKFDSSGQRFKQIIDALEFSDYPSAQNYINTRTSGNPVIVSPDPFKSPVPIEALPDYKQVFVSKEQVKIQSGTTSEVKIFEYTANN